MSGMKLFREIRDRGCFYPGYVAVKKVQRVKEPAFADLTVVDASEVFRFVYECSDQDEWSLFEDVPNVAPPFPRMWIEAGFPKFATFPDRVDPILPQLFGVRFGMSVESVRLPADGDLRLPAREVLANLPVPKAAEGDPLDHLAYAAGNMDADVAGGWVLIVHPFVLMGRDAFGPLFAQTVVADSSGAPVATSGRVGYSIGDNEGFKRAGEGYHVPFVATLLALSFMHCRNVTVEKAVDRPAGKRAKGDRGVRYHVLKIDAMRRVMERTVGSAASAKTALHVCRGHFKTYTADAPLFGKNVGTYWWADNVRGNPANGVVVKDYEVAS